MSASPPSGVQLKSSLIDTLPACFSYPAMTAHCSDQAMVKVRPSNSVYVADQDKSRTPLVQTKIDPLKRSTWYTRA